MKKKAYCENVPSKQNETASKRIWEWDRQTLLPFALHLRSAAQLHRFKKTLASPFPVLSHAAVIFNPS